jgi:hypothetical protein
MIKALDGSDHLTAAEMRKIIRNLVDPASSICLSRRLSHACVPSGTR